MSRRLVPFLFVALAACGNPDNYALGAISAQGGAPVVVFDHINSAIHNTALLTDAQSGQKTSVDVIILSNHGDLCGALAKRPDYLKNPDDQLIAMMLIAPFDILGTFFIGSQKPGEQVNDFTAILAAPGNAATANIYPSSNGFFAVTQFDVGGDASGSFDLIFEDGGGGHEFQGRYKTQPCAALATASLP